MLQSISQEQKCQCPEERFVFKMFLLIFERSLGLEPSEAPKLRVKNSPWPSIYKRNYKARAAAAGLRLSWRYIFTSLEEHGVVKKIFLSKSSQAEIEIFFYKVLGRMCSLKPCKTSLLTSYLGTLGPR